MKTQIKAEIVAHSVNEQGDELISVLATFPRIILAEVNTHRMLSKNTSSSRAIPFAKMVESVKNDPFIPIAWQKEHKGMQGTEYITDKIDLELNINAWLKAKDDAVSNAKYLNHGVKEGRDNAVTKQLCNRLLEPFMWTTMLITGPKSGWDNFFKLRCPQYQLSLETVKSKKEALQLYPNVYESFTELDWLKINKGQAEIHMMALAECIWDAVNESKPKQLEAGEWHIPFVDKMSDLDIDKVFKAGLGPMNRQEVRVKTSVAMAARTSYTVVGEEKALDYEAMIGLHDRLLAWDPPHSSPLEHAAKAMSEREYKSFIKGEFEVTHSEPEYEDLGEFPFSSQGWCNNFKGFIPYRYMVDNGNQEAEDQDS